MKNKFLEDIIICINYEKISYNLEHYMDINFNYKYFNRRYLIHKRLETLRNAERRMSFDISTFK